MPSPGSSGRHFRQRGRRHPFGKSYKTDWPATSSLTCRWRAWPRTTHRRRESPRPRARSWCGCCRGCGPALGREYHEGVGVDQIIPGYVGIVVHGRRGAHHRHRRSRKSTGAGASASCCSWGAWSCPSSAGQRRLRWRSASPMDLAQSLYKKYGFAVMGVRKRYYTDNNEDAYIMTTGEIQSAAYQRELAANVEGHARRWGTSERVLTSP